MPEGMVQRMFSDPGFSDGFSDIFLQRVRMDMVSLFDARAGINREISGREDPVPHPLTIDH